MLGSTHVYFDNSYLSLDSISTVPKGYLTRHITTLAAHRLTEICRAVDMVVSCC
jgi:mRNA-degrading endonuclease toxin of MazEF toxin-antitoxin module